MEDSNIMPLIAYLDVSYLIYKARASSVIDSGHQTRGFGTRSIAVSLQSHVANWAKTDLWTLDGAQQRWQLSEEQLRSKSNFIIKSNFNNCNKPPASFSFLRAAGPTCYLACKLQSLVRVLGVIKQNFVLKMKMYNAQTNERNAKAKSQVLGPWSWPFWPSWPFVGHLAML